MQHQTQLKASFKQQTSQEALNEYFTGSPSCYLSDPRSTVSLTLPLWPTSHWRSSQPFRDAIKAFVCGYLGCMHIRLAATKSHWLQPCTAAITFHSAENCQRRLDAWASCCWSISLCPFFVRLFTRRDLILQKNLKGCTSSFKNIHLDLVLHFCKVMHSMCLFVLQCLKCASGFYCFNWSIWLK